MGYDARAVPRLPADRRTSTTSPWRASSATPAATCRPGSATASSTANGTSRSTATAMGSPNSATSAPWAKTTRSSTTSKPTGSNSPCSAATRSPTPSSATRWPTMSRTSSAIKTNMMRGVLDSLAESINPKSAINELVVDMDDAQNDDVGGSHPGPRQPRRRHLLRHHPVRRPAGAPRHRTHERRPAAPHRHVRRRQRPRPQATADPRPRSASRRSSTASRNAPNSSPECSPKPASRIFSKASTTKSPSPPTSAGRCASTASGPRSTPRPSTPPWGSKSTPPWAKAPTPSASRACMQIKQTQEMIMQQFGPSNPVVGIPQYLNTITDMLALSNIKNVGRYFMTPRPQVLQQIAAAPKEPDAMTVAAKAQYEKVKSETAQAMGDQQIRQQKQQAGRRLPPRAAQAENRLRPAEARNRTGQGVRRRKPDRPNRSRSDRGGQDRRRHPHRPSRRRACRSHEMR